MFAVKMWACLQRHSANGLQGATHKDTVDTTLFRHLCAYFSFTQSENSYVIPSYIYVGACDMNQLQSTVELFMFSAMTLERILNFLVQTFKVAMMFMINIDCKYHDEQPCIGQKF